MDESQDRYDSVVTVPEDRKLKKDFDSGVREDWADGYKEYHNYDKTYIERYKQFRTDVIETITGYKLPVITLGRDPPREKEKRMSLMLRSCGLILEDFIRDILGMEALLVFDRNCKPDVINKITLDYHRLTKIRPGQKSEDVKYEFLTWDYTEHLIIDRESETLEHIQNIGTAYKVSRKYEIEDGIESLLDNFEAEDFFTYIEGNSDDVVDTLNETKDYTITIEYKKSPSRIIHGSYDKNGLPKDFAGFAEIVLDFMCFYGLGEILDPSVYGKVKRRNSEYIFCSVTFEEGYKSYYYLTEDDSIEIGDFVIVPVGKDNHETVVEVVNIEYFSEEKVPLPIEKTKRIIRKCVNKDYDPPVE